MERLIIPFLLLGIILNVNCATTSLEPVARRNYDTLESNRVIYVHLKDKRIIPLVEFKFTDTHLKGKIKKSVKVEEEMIEIALENVEFIVVRKIKFTERPVLVGLFVLTGVAVAWVLAHPVTGLF